MEKKKQHLVPQSYLEAWCDPTTPEGQTPYVWVFDKDGSTVRRKAPKKIFYEADTYTITGPLGERDLRLENRLSELESGFARVRREKIEKENLLNQDDVVALLGFAAAMLARTESQREHVVEQWSRPLDMGEKIEKAAARGLIAPQPTTSEGPHLTMDELRRIVAQPLQATLATYTNAFYTIFSTLDMAILKTTTQPGFITSDTPCYAGASELDERPQTIYDSVLHLRTTEVFLPLSPRFCLYLSRNGLIGRLDVPTALVDDINRRTRFACHRNFIVSQNVKRAYWFSETPTTS